MEAVEGLDGAFVRQPREGDQPGTRRTLARGGLLPALLHRDRARHLPAFLHRELGDDMPEHQEPDVRVVQVA
jgi:hypothetical protein